MRPPGHILSTLIIAQFACTATWFSGNVIVNELAEKTGFGPEASGYLLSSVQLGFIIGTLVFALFTIADRFSPSKVFFGCALLTALCNLSLLFIDSSKIALLLARFGTGFFLAGIYPVGMKIAADYYGKKLGKALGLLVGALVLGSALPYLIRALAWDTDHTLIIKATSAITVIGGLLLWLLVPDGPHRKPSIGLQLGAGIQLFKTAPFRKAAFGYFGHMWELYAFWAFTPLAITAVNGGNGTTISVPLMTFLVFLGGALSCAIGGFWSLKIGSKKVALRALMVSGCCCLLSPLFFGFTTMGFVTIWCLWGMAVTADSPQFSSLVAQTVAADLRGTGLTLVNCIGFAISIVSIQLLSLMSENIAIEYLFVLLAIGPLIGILQLKKGKTGSGY
ncbi:MFS transporter [Maribacter sp. 2-571]|uniref:MFS transporter n=1 Tax=Maribacter sp. 2-571 TaxID=3417569 RepID=UPI003D33A09B